MASHDSEWLTTSQAATALGLSAKTIREQIRQGRLQAHKAHGQPVRVSRTEIERYRREQLGGHGWAQRRQPAHVPGRAALEKRAQRARTRARAAPESGELSPQEPA